MNDDCAYSETPFTPHLNEVWNKVDSDGNPLGGCVIGYGLHIKWQDGPTRHEEKGDVFYERNGAFVEEPIMAAIERLKLYQRSKFACQENQDAISYLERALMELESRRMNRTERGVYGKNEV